MTKTVLLEFAKNTCPTHLEKVISILNRKYKGCGFYRIGEKLDVTAIPIYFTGSGKNMSFICMIQEKDNIKYNEHSNIYSKITKISTNLHPQYIGYELEELLGIQREDGE